MTNEEAKKLAEDSKTPAQAAAALVSILGVILKMSDEAEALGGARCISGVASLHKMQSSIQKNAGRMAALSFTLLAKVAA